MKFKASSLVYSLFIVTLVGILCSAFVLASHYHNIHLVNTEARLKQISYMQSGIHLLQGNYRESEYFEEEKTLFSNKPNSMVKLSRKPWGAFDWISCQSVSKFDSLRKDFLVGIQLDTSTVLYLADNNNSLSISGQTKLVGNVYLPKGGIKRAYIEGKAFQGKDLVNGLILKSKKKIPPKNELLFKQLKMNLNFSSIKKQNNYRNSIESESKSIISNEFNQETLYLFDTNSIVLENISISGNIIISSKKSIRIRQSAILQNVLIFSNKIVIENNVKGSFQAFAVDSIIVGENCEFTYPTVLGIIGKKNTGTQYLKIGKNTKLTGCILQEREKVASNDVSIIELAESSKVIGEIYGNTKVVLKGAVIGNIFCNSFSLKTSSSIYENHLLDAEINVHKRPNGYIGPVILDSNSRKKKEVVIEL